MGGIRGGGNFWFVRTPVRTLLGVAFMVRAFLFLFFFFTGHHRGGGLVVEGMEVLNLVEWEGDG